LEKMTREEKHTSFNWKLNRRGILEGPSWEWISCLLYLEKVISTLRVSVVFVVSASRVTFAEHNHTLVFLLS
jgi:hypothetical protein